MLRFHDMIRNIWIYDALLMDISEPQGSNFINWKKTGFVNGTSGNTILRFHVFDNK